MAEYTGTLSGNVVQDRHATMVAGSRASLGLGLVSLEDAAPGDTQSACHAAQVEGVYEKAFAPKHGANNEGPQTARQNRQRKLRQNLLHCRCFEPVITADGEECFGADAYQPQEYKAPDEYLMAHFLRAGTACAITALRILF
jgi:hypothetical protein